MSMPVVLYSSIAFAAALIIVGLAQYKRRTSMLPPGPPGDPLIGNLLRMPTKDSALVFHEWSKTYGPVMLLKVLGRPMIILDSYQAAVDLLDKKGLIYSDRPKFTLYELLGWDPTLTFLQYGERFNKHRQMHQSYLSRSRLEDFKSIQTQEARTLLRHLIQCPPDKYETFVSRFATGTITQIVAGHRITSEDDPYLRMSNIVYEGLAKTGPPGGSPIDLFPLLQHFPAWFLGASHIGVVKACRPTVRELHEHPVRVVKTQQEHGEALPSFVLDRLEQMEDGEDEEDLKSSAATMFAAGEATTWSTLTVFIIAMVLHPEVQAKAQKEIESIVGDLRLPEFGDRGDLPFVEAILQETLRGMLIPKGALIFANIKGMALDESVYSNPLSFQPERFLAKPSEAGEPHFNQAFGFGRRFPWIAIASILATCRITNAVDESGEIIVPDNTLADGLVRQVPIKSPDPVQR
ncbi:cytochrome P450 [Mycena olivaceomarginata]|nr:cytochrome P450 [Mycena olivaceomarginata]